MNAPLDETHEMCAEARAEIRARVARARARVARWTPRPMPEGWGR